MPTTQYQHIFQFDSIIRDYLRRRLAFRCLLILAFLVSSSACELLSFLAVTPTCNILNNCKRDF